MLEIKERIQKTKHRTRVVRIQSANVENEKKEKCETIVRGYQTATDI